MSDRTANFRKRIASSLLPTTAAGWFLLSLALLLIGTVNVPLQGLDVRFALMLEEMRLYGIGIFPTINQVPYTDYFSPWCIAAYLTTLGGRHLCLALLALPSMLCAAYVAAMTFAIGERTWKGAGQTAAAILLATMEYQLHVASTFGIDGPTAAAAITMLWLLERRVSIPVQLAWFVPLLLLTLAVRGPMGPILVGTAVAGWLLAAWDWKRILAFGVTGFATLAAGCGLGVLAIKAGGPELWNVFLQWHLLSRFGEAENEYLMYFTSGFASFAPATVLALAALLCRWRDFGKAPRRNWLGFVLLPMILLSIPSWKHLRYVALTIPVFALLGAGWFAEAGGAAWVRRQFGRLLTLLAPLLPWLLILAVAALYGVSLFHEDFATPYHLPLWQWGAAVLLLAAFGWAVPRAAKGAENAALARIGTAAGIFIIAALGPFLALREESTTFVTAVESQRTGNLYFYGVGPDHADLQYRFAMAPEKRREPRYIAPPAAAGQTQEGYLFVMYPGTAFAETAPNFRAGDVLLVSRRFRRDVLEPACAEAGVKLAYRVVEGDLGHTRTYALILTADALPQEPAGTPYRP